MYAEASAQARCYQSDGTRRACSISELGARRRVTPDLWLGRAEPWGAEMAFGRDRLAMEWGLPSSNTNPSTIEVRPRPKIDI